MDTANLVIRGAREHNLRNIDIDLPKNRLIVFTGVSGSGKSSLAFDTIYAEGQRRYLESLSSYARQFLDQLPKPNVDYIGGLAPSVSIQQKTAGRNPRSTVGTITEIADYMRVLFARLGQGHCPQCNRPITAQTREQIIDQILTLPSGTPLVILAPIARNQKGEFKELFAAMVQRGFVRARVNGQWVRLDEDLRLDRRMKHTVEIVVDRLRLASGEAVRGQRSRIAEAVEQALELGGGNLIVHREPSGRSETHPEGSHADTALTDILFSAYYACTACNISYEPPTPQLFSFNSPHGMCLTCDGLGTAYVFDPELLVPDPSLSVYDGAIPLIGAVRSMGRWRKHIYEGVAKALGINLRSPWNKLSPQQRELLLYGSGEQTITWYWRMRRGGVYVHSGRWEGIIPQLVSQFKKTAAGPRRHQLEKYMRIARCPDCQGHRLNPQARAVRLAGKTWIELGQMQIGELQQWFAAYEAGLGPREQLIAGQLVKEIRSRLQFLLDVGLHYLTLDRAAPTLSGGEAQRIRLASQIGSGLVGVLYVLDEPSIGLHPRDNRRLLASLQRLRDMGNTVIVVEHDEETMRAADYLVDFGPGPGHRGGHIVAAGPPQQVRNSEQSLTAQYLSGRKQIPTPQRRRPGNGQVLRVVGARHNNLKNITVEFPLGQFICVTGVSGSGKSSLVNDVLLNGLRQRLRRSTTRSATNWDDAAEDDNGDDISDNSQAVGDHDRIDGVEAIDKVIAIDQSPIGRTPRSNPATYIKVWDEIRHLFAQMPDAKVRGYTPGRFSFNKPGGRCDACEGNGATRLEMDFLADVWVTCPVCEGRRFNRETLQVRYRGKTIYDILEMEVGEALEHFEHVPKIRAMLQTLHHVGLDYIKLGQPSPTLSGGEAQRIKLARELVRRSTGRTLYILDEPTTGLHFEDVRKLLEVLHGFVDAGNTVVVIEHHLDVIKTADWIIDLGPEGGDAGGEVVVCGTPEEVARCPSSYTGQALRQLLTRRPLRRKGAAAAATATPSSRLPNGRITHIEVRGACQHNLKNVSVRLPREQMTVFCGPSGSGKSSLAIDTIYAEGQRRYVESLSSYARQFLGQIHKPKVEQITGLSPAISIEQKTTSRSPRSTVGTITEIYDYLRVLYARLGERHCPRCGRPVATQTTDEIVEKVLALPEGSKVYILAPVTLRGQERYEELWDELRRSGFTRVRVDGRSYTLEGPPELDYRRQHCIEVVIDRAVIRPLQRSRIAEAVEQALSVGRGIMHLAHVDPARDEPQWVVDRFSQHLACEPCGLSFEPLSPQNYSFNSPLGWCPLCEGLGFQRGTSEELLIRDPHRSLRQGAVAAWPPLTPDSPWLPYAEALAAHAGIDLDTPWHQLPPEQRRVVLYGTGETWIPLRTGPEGASGRRRKGGTDHAPVQFLYKGILPALDEAARVAWVYRQRLDALMDEIPCSACGGGRLREDAAATRFQGLTLPELCRLTIGEAVELFRTLRLTPYQQQIAGEIVREVTHRLRFLVDVGLDYLTLARPGPTLSGGEAQRIRLAAQIGSGLTGVLYVLDEPTIGLHPRDNQRLLGALKRLRDLGNTLIVVEHDREVIAASDFAVDFGPGAGRQGGEITAAAPPDQLPTIPQSLTGRYLGGHTAIPVPNNRRAVTNKAIVVRNARLHNLKNIDVTFPLGVCVAVSGVSGSGKSTLVHDVLYQALRRRLDNRAAIPVACDDIEGTHHLNKVIRVDQDPIGASPASNAATYTGVFDLIRDLFARLPESKVRGYTRRRFSFNQKGGRCEACEGMGQKRIEMHFLPDVWIECDVCGGKRYNAETLTVRYRGKNIAEILEMPVSQALELFADVPKIRAILQTLDDVGLGYLPLGQPAPTLSGGEAQRVKLAAELARPDTGRTLYILDEPTTGLHFDDVYKLLLVIHRLVDLGNTVIVVEHNLDVLKTADWIIDLGPEGGDRGGQVVACGPPDELVAAAERGVPTHTGRFLKDLLQAGPHAPWPRQGTAHLDPLRNRFGGRQSHDIPQGVSLGNGESQKKGESEANGESEAEGGYQGQIESLGKMKSQGARLPSRRPSSIEQHMPWVKNGPAWHLGPKGFPPGRSRRWPLDVLQQLLVVIQSWGAEIDWNHQEFVVVRVPGTEMEWGRIYTKDAERLILECRTSPQGRAGRTHSRRTPRVAGGQTGEFLRWEWGPQPVPVESVAAELRSRYEAFRLSVTGTATASSAETSAATEAV